MTQKRSSKSGKGRKPNAPLPARIVEAALGLSATDGWASVSPHRVAQGLKENLGEVLRVTPTQAAIAGLIFRHIDDAMLRQVNKIDNSDSPRDRLFEVLMIRFDVLQQHRSGLVSLLAHYQRMPLLAVCRVPTLIRSMDVVLSAAGLQAHHMIDVARGPVLTLGYLSVLRVWMKDESADMAATMSALDKMLSRLERLQLAVSRRAKARD